MKIAQGLKVIAKGWIRKPKGFRVRFQQQTSAGVESVYSPPIEDSPLTSDVTAWRYAWKLWQATREEAGTQAQDILYNITVVDDQDHPVRFFGTGEVEIYNSKGIEPIRDNTTGDGKKS